MYDTGFRSNRFWSVRLRIGGASRQAAVGDDSDGQGKGWRCMLVILAQRQAYWPITKAIYELFQRLGDGPYIASALGVWAMALLTLTILSANAFLGKRMGAIFRV